MPFPLLLSFPHSFPLRKIKVPCTPAHKIIWNNLKQSWKQMYYSEESNRKFSLRGIPHEDPFFFFFPFSLFSFSLSLFFIFIFSFFVYYISTMDMQGQYRGTPDAFTKSRTKPCHLCKMVWVTATAVTAKIEQAIVSWSQMRYLLLWSEKKSLTKEIMEVFCSNVDKKRIQKL